MLQPIFCTHNKGKRIKNLGIAGNFARKRRAEKIGIPNQYHKARMED